MRQPCVSRTALCLLGATIAVHSHAQVIFERPKPSKEEGRYKEEMVAMSPTESNIKGEKADARVIRLEIKAGELYSTRIRDVWREEADAKWRKEFTDRVVISERIGEFSYDWWQGASRGRPGVHMFVDEDIVATVETYYLDPNGKQVGVEFYEVTEREIPAHDFLRWVIRMSTSVVSRRGNTVVKSTTRYGRKDATWFSWLSGDHLAIYVRGIDTDPSHIVNAYLKKFPSSLPRRLEINKKEWGRREVAFWLDKMKKALDSQDKNPTSRASAYGSMLELSWRTVLPPGFMEFTRQSSLAVKQQAYERLRDWWLLNREKSYWSKKYAKLVVRGQTPEDFARAEEKRRKDELEARLNAPIPDAKLAELEQRLIEKLETKLAYHVRLKKEAYGEECEAGFEKTPDGRWLLHVRQHKNAELDQVTYTGPDILRQRDRAYPLMGVFPCSYTDRLSGRSVATEEAYRYSKLQDLWIRTSRK